MKNVNQIQRRTQGVKSGKKQLMVADLNQLDKRTNQKQKKQAETPTRLQKEDEAEASLTFRDGWSMLLNVIGVALPYAF